MAYTFQYLGPMVTQDACGVLAIYIKTILAITKTNIIIATVF